MAAPPRPPDAPPRNPAMPPRGGKSAAPRRRAAPRRPAARRSSWRFLAEFNWRRWMAVWICVAVLLIGIPLAHAMVGDLGALLLLVGVGGFALGRSTAKVNLPSSRKGKG